MKLSEKIQLRALLKKVCASQDPILCVSQAQACDGCPVKRLLSTLPTDSKRSEKRLETKSERKPAS